MSLEVKVSPRQFTNPALAKQNPNLWTTRETTLEIEMTEEAFQKLFADDRRPTVRVILDVVDEEEEED